MNRNTDRNAEGDRAGKRTRGRDRQTVFFFLSDICGADCDLKCERLTAEYRKAVGGGLEQNVLVQKAFFERGQRLEQQLVC